MILMIAGSSHTGKTLAAQRVLERYQYTYLSIDHLKMGLIRSGNCSLTPESSDEELTNYLWNIVKEIIKTAIENSQNLVVEGCYIPFDWEKDFPPFYSEQIKFVCLIFSQDYIEKKYEDIINFADVIEKRSDNECFTREFMINKNIENLVKCRKYGLNFILIDEKYDVDIKL